MEVTEYYLDSAPDVVTVQNPLSGDWFIEGQKGETRPYIRSTFADASKMHQAVINYNTTGEAKSEGQFKSLPKSEFKTRTINRAQPRRQ